MFGKIGIALAVAAAAGSTLTLTATGASAHVASAHTVANRTPECTIGQLKVSYTNNKQINEGALDGMSKADKVVMFRNVSQSVCVLQGYPGSAALNSHGTQVQQARRTGQPVHPVFLRPGGVTSALVAANTASCDHPSNVAGLLVTAPDQYRSSKLTGYGEFCLHSLTISPVAPGNAAGLRL